MNIVMFMTCTTDGCTGHKQAGLVTDSRTARAASAGPRSLRAAQSLSSRRGGGPAADVGRLGLDIFLRHGTAVPGLDRDP